MTTFERAIATRCELLFGHGENPHVMLINEGTYRKWLALPGNLHRVRRACIGSFVCWQTEYETYQDGQPGAPLNDDGQLVYRYPEKMQCCIDYIHDIGGRALAYVSPGVWARQGYSADHSVDTIVDFCRRHNLDGIYSDGASFSTNSFERYHAFRRLRSRGLYVICHFSSDCVQYSMPYEEFMNVGLWGEINANLPGDPKGMLQLFKQMCRVDTYPQMLMMYKPAPKTLYYNKPEQYMPILARLLFVEHVGTTTFDTFETHFLPTWLEEQAAYRADPTGYVSRLAETW